MRNSPDCDGLELSASLIKDAVAEGLLVRRGLADHTPVITPGMASDCADLHQPVGTLMAPSNCLPHQDLDELYALMAPSNCLPHQEHLRLDLGRRFGNRPFPLGPRKR